MTPRYVEARRRPTALFEADPLLGWRNRRNVSVVHESYEFVASYQTDDRGARVTPPRRTPSEAVRVLGCSWAFGHGVADEQTFAYRLAECTGQHIVNAAVSGYSPSQALMLMQCEKDVTRYHATVYVWVPDQLVRMAGRPEWLKLNARHVPSDAFQPRHILNGGKVELAPPMSFADESAVEAEDDWYLTFLERSLTALVLQAMSLFCRARGQEFRVLVPPLRHDREVVEAAEMVVRLEALGVDVVDMTARPSPRCFYRLDGHPTEGWHQMVAAHLRTVLNLDMTSGTAT